MTNEEVLAQLENIKKPFIISGFKVKEPDGTELNFITQHYVVGEYIAVYKKDSCIFQGGFNSQTQMNNVFKKDIKKALQRNAVILYINTRQIINDES